MPCSQYLILREKRRFAKGLHQELRLSARKCKSSPPFWHAAPCRYPYRIHTSPSAIENVYFSFSLLEYYRFAFYSALKKYDINPIDKSVD